MRYINNKGQTLVIFVIMLPIILTMFTLIIDLGILYIDKRNVDNNVSSAVEYYLNNILDDNIETKLTSMLNKNIKDIENIYVNNTSEYIEVKVIKKNKSLYKIITNDNNIEVTYKGYKDSKEVIKG